MSKELVETLPEAISDPLSQRFVRIKPGAFMMGNSLSSDELVERWGGKKALYDTAPSHSVTITRDFYLCRFPVRVRDFERFVNATHYKTTAETDGAARLFGNDGVWRDVQGGSWRSPGFPQTADHPVVCVSWFDALKYVEWLNENYQRALPDGFQYALPTEAEWEYACRAGTNSEFFWGTNDPKDGHGYLNAADETAAPNKKKWDSFFPFETNYSATSPVGCFKPNVWGLYDMLGNVGEWCVDGLAAYPQTTVVDPIGSSNNTTRIIRGGSWCYGPGSCRSASRSVSDAFSCVSRIGFRLAVRPVETPNLTPNGAQKKKKAFVWTINGVETVFKHCSAGRFTMGSPTSEEGRNPDETQRNVTISKGFWILETPVTQALWKAVDGKNPSFFKGDDLPVERVSWNQCVEFIARLNKEDGLAPDGFVFDLPTEAEWEYACRAGSPKPYYFDSELTNNAANYGEKVGRTTPVKTYRPNAWGLYDTLGNVGEWCSDWYGAYPESSETDPVGASDGNKRVFRGGGWCYGAAYCRAAHRNFVAPEFNANRVGFRLVMRLCDKNRLDKIHTKSVEALKKQSKSFVPPALSSTTLSQPSGVTNITKNKPKKNKSNHKSPKHNSPSQNAFQEKTTKVDYLSPLPSRSYLLNDPSWRAFLGESNNGDSQPSYRYGSSNLDSSSWRAFLGESNNDDSQPSYRYGSSNLDSSSWRAFLGESNNNDSQPSYRNGSSNLDSPSWRAFLRESNNNDSQPSYRYGSPNLDSPSWRAFLGESNNNDSQPSYRNGSSNLDSPSRRAVPKSFDFKLEDDDDDHFLLVKNDEQSEHDQVNFSNGRKQADEAEKIMKVYGLKKRSSKPGDDSSFNS